jgi:glycosyltransferase involved in cell wall biosynthesis
MHVGLNLIFLVPGETGGMEVAARELIPELVREAPPGMRFTAFVNREAAAAGDGPWGEVLPAVTVPVHARSRVQWVLGEQALLPAMGARERVTLMHSLASTAPLTGTFRRVVTIHDLIYARFPEAHSGFRDKGMRVLVPLGARRSRRVIVDSESTRADLLAIGLPADRVDVVPLGLGAVQRAEPLDGAALRERLDLGAREVLLTLSAKRPHKNLRALIEALALIAPEQRPLLVLAGYPTDYERELRGLARDRGLGSDVRFPAWLSAEELEGLWAIARAFVYPSLYEGFGLPVLEAMARGVPVACSDASSLPEVAGDAALMFDPASTEQIATAIKRLLSDRQLVERLRQRGRTRAEQFSWRRTARMTLDVYARALGRPPGGAPACGPEPACGGSAAAGADPSSA